MDRGGSSLVLVSENFRHMQGTTEQIPAIYILIQAAVFNIYGADPAGDGNYIIVNGEEKYFKELLLREFVTLNSALSTYRKAPRRRSAL